MKNKIADFKIARSVLRKAKKAIKSIKGVWDVGIGFKMVDGTLTSTPSIVVLVTDKLPISDLDETDLIPENIEGVPIDVVESNPVPHYYNYQPFALCRPLVGGLSIQNPKLGGIYGTMGALVIDNLTGEYCGLTNNHVLFKAKIALGSLKGQEAPVRQPYGALGEATVGYALRGDEALDAAIFSIAEPFLPTESFVNGLQAPISDYYQGNQYVGKKVFKVGARTGLTFGLISAEFTNHLIIVPNLLKENPSGNTEISMGGDSGSVYLTDENHPIAIGLHFGGDADNNQSKEFAYAYKMAKVCKKLNIRFRSNYSGLIRHKGGSKECSGDVFKYIA
jgi:hypothetical protein